MYFICFRWGNKPANKVWWNRTKHPKRWDSMPHWHFSLPIVNFWFSNVIYCLWFYFHWDDQIYVAHDMLGSLLQSLHDFYFYVVDTWALPTTYSYMYLVDKLYHIAVELLSRFISYLLKLSCTCMALDMIVILLMILCEGSPPKNTCIIVDEIVWGESPQDHLCYLWKMFTKWKEKYACFMSNSYTNLAITCHLTLPEISCNLYSFCDRTLK